MITSQKSTNTYRFTIYYYNPDSRHTKSHTSGVRLRIQGLYYALTPAS